MAALGAMLDEMLALDLKGWHPRENVPQTKALLDQKMLGIGGLEICTSTCLTLVHLCLTRKT